MKVKSLILSIVALLLANCVSTKYNQSLPEWVKNRVSDPDYYIGLGYAPKEKHSTTYYERASKAALNDLATEISVNVNTSTLLVTISTDKQTKDNLSSLIQTRVDQNIEGYEKVASYENRKGYWIYYRLLKSQYMATQNKKRQLATNRAGEYYSIAVEGEQRNDIKAAIIAYTKALDAIKEYFNDNITYKYEGKIISLIPAAHTKIYELLNSINIAPLQNSIICSIGNDISDKKLGCKVTMNGEPIVQIPIAINYSERDIATTSLYTDEKGQITFPIPNIRSKKTKEIVTLNIDKNAILLESAVDYAIRRWLSAAPTSTATIEIIVQKPNVYIASDELNFDLPVVQNNLKTAFCTFLIRDGYTMALSPAEADCTLDIRTRTTQKNIGNGMYRATLNTQIILSKKGEIIYNRNLKDIKGVQLTPQEAGLEAYKEATRQVEIRLYRELQEALYKQ